MIDLLPCPFCGESCEVEQGSSTDDREGRPVYMFCGLCGSQGPWVYCPIDNLSLSEALAAEQWNKRAQA